MTLYFEDFPEGHEIELGEWTPTREEIIAFAREWDPQPFHLDEEFARQGPFGGLVASGWHSICVWGRLYVEGVHARAASMGGGGLEGIRFRKPVRPGHRLRERVRVLEARPSTTRPERGTTLWEGVLVDDAGEIVLEMRGRAFFRRRAASDFSPTQPARPDVRSG
jgi:acyl dehydratase